VKFLKTHNLLPFSYFCQMNFPSRLIEEAVDQMASLPGVGRKTALRLVLQLLRRDSDEVARFSRAFTALKEGIKSCSICGNLSDDDVCPICADSRRDASLVCIVENIRDVLAIESTEQFKGLYHVLGGVISPLDGVGPSDLNIASLATRLDGGAVQEVIFALSTTMEGETTSYYLYKKIAPFNVRVSAIARGIAIGDELQHADELTLARSIMQRMPYENAIGGK
jgi:recombination protein RecR